MRLILAALLVAAISLSGSLALQHAPPTQILTEALEAIRSGRPQQAVATLEALRDKQPDSAVVHHYLGLAYEKQDRYSAAVGSLTRALQLDPSRMAALAPMAWSQFYLGRSADARHSFTRYLGVAPGDPQARLGLGLVEAEDGHPERARLHFLETIQLTRAQGDRENEALARSALADVELRNGNLLTASRLLEAAIALRPADGALHLKLAHVLDISGDTEGAAAARATHARLSAGAARP
jgi:protein O-GlcNAc transferase